MLFKLLDYKFTGLLCMLAVLGYLSIEMFVTDKQAFLPGKMTSAHHQVELACDLCHSPFEGVKQQACLDCHGDALNAASDSHAAKVFNDPRSYSMLEKINAKQCISCHAEHLENQYAGKISTQPTDFCFACHDDIAQERPSHKGLAEDGCSASGCHNYHDNTALYEDFVKKHLDEEDTSLSATLPLRNRAEIKQQQSSVVIKYLAKQDQDASVPIQDEKIIHQWANSEHARTGVNCSDCHQQKTDSSTMAEWSDNPEISVCKECHDKEMDNFYKGKHGMRIAAGLSAMKPKLARIPMQQKAHEQELSCNSCHPAHDYNTKKSAVEACLTCHNDKHSKTYIKSPHYQLWLKELSEDLPAGSGVSCASCHLPRSVIKENNMKIVLVNHNQNANLRPNSKMVRDVCMQCHGLAFSLESLADKDLMLNNYSGKATLRHKTMDMVKTRTK